MGLDQTPAYLLGILIAVVVHEAGHALAAAVCVSLTLSQPRTTLRSV
jgi:hypothetical protein